MRSRACEVFCGGVATGEKSIVGIEGGIEQVEAVELLEYLRVEQERCGLRIAGMLLMEALQAFDSAGKVEIVETVLVGFAHQRIEVKRIGVNARSARSKDSQQEKKKRQSRSALERFPNRNNHLSSGRSVSLPNQFGDECHRLMRTSHSQKT